MKEVRQSGFCVIRPYIEVPYETVFLQVYVLLCVIKVFPHCKHLENTLAL